MAHRGQIGLKVAFVQPPSPPNRDIMRDFAGGFGTAEKCSRPRFGHSGTAMPYMPFLYAAGAVEKNGHQVRFIDAQALDLDKEMTLNQVLTFSPDIVIAVLSLPSLEADLGFALAMWERSPRCRIIVGGTVAKSLTREIAESPGIDYIVTGYEETAIPDLVEALANTGDTSRVHGVAWLKGDQLKQIPAGAPPNLDRLGMPPFHLLPMDTYRSWEFPLEKSFFTIQFGRQRRYFPLFLSRGCSFSCGYCPYPIGFGKRVRARAPENVVAEIEHLYQEHGVDAFAFRDQNFTLLRKRVEAMCNLILKRRLPIMWSCETRVDLVDKPLLKLMRRSGCQRIFFGIETGDKTLFEAEGKPGAAYEQTKQAFSLCRRVGILPCAHVMVGLPGENADSIDKTEALLSRIKAVQGNCAIVTPYPGTAFFEEMLALGQIASNSWARFTGNDPVLELAEYSGAQILAAQARLRQFFERQARNAWRRRLGRVIKPPFNLAAKVLLGRRGANLKTQAVGK